MNTQDNYVSLFDYLGKASGGELGKQVFQAAKKARTTPMVNKGYQMPNNMGNQPLNLQNNQQQNIV